MAQEVIRRTGYDMVYESLDNVDLPEYTGPVRIRWLSYCTLHDGYRIWRVSASYARNRKPTVYRIVAKKRIDAVKKLLDLANHMKYISEITPLTADETEEVLSKPLVYHFF